MKAILTRYLGPTNTRGSRVKAWAEGVPPVTMTWHAELGVEENHTAAASDLVAKYGWGVKTRLVGGGLPDGTGYAFVMVRL
jgi:hypothetical protein